MSNKQFSLCSCCPSYSLWSRTT